ncbi:MAG TPA: hypothetical protein VLH77_02625, partial [Gammaproteobacteria bacterium]|nr:hypothetical protein [Gammaproteobacteria bacterium]
SLACRIFSRSQPVASVIQLTLTQVFFFSAEITDSFLSIRSSCCLIAVSFIRWGCKIDLSQLSLPRFQAVSFSSSSISESVNPVSSRITFSAIALVRAAFSLLAAISLLIQSSVKSRARASLKMIGRLFISVIALSDSFIYICFTIV